MWLGSPGQMKRTKSNLFYRNKNEANERMGHLMVSDRAAHDPLTPELQVVDVETVEFIN